MKIYIDIIFKCFYDFAKPKQWNTNMYYVYGDAALPSTKNKDGSPRFFESVGTGGKPIVVSFAGFGSAEAIEAVTQAILPEVRDLSIADARELEAWSKTFRHALNGNQHIEGHALPFNDYATIISSQANRLGIAFEKASARIIDINDSEPGSWSKYSKGKNLGSGLILGYRPAVQAVIWAHQTLR